jgi:hypothetical protein
VVWVVYYEGSEYYLFNPKEGILKLTYFLPLFMNDSVVAAVGNSFGSGSLQLLDIKGKNYFGINSFNDIEECFHIKNHYYFSIRNTNNFHGNLTYFLVSVTTAEK